MESKYIIKSSINSLLINKSRTFLTILGIVIGITAIILIVSLGKGAQDLILGEIKSIGPKIIVIIPGRQPSGPTDVLATFTDSLRERDIDALNRKTNVPNISRIMPLVFGGESVSYGSDTHRPTVLGANSLFAELYDLYPATGRLFSDDEIKSYGDVVLIGNKVKKELFEGVDPVGQKVKIKNKSFRVIGVLQEKGQFAFINFDDSIILPYTTAQRHIFGIKHFHRIIVEADKEENVSRAVSDIKSTIRNSHNIDNPDKDDFFVETQVDALETVTNITNILTLFLSAVATISLVVGGIGVMNIMLVSVVERIREIGLRKALGATSKDILKQFLYETILLTSAGGIIGVALGILLSFLASIILTKYAGLDWNFTFPAGAALIGIAVSATVGLVFGLYPANQAAKKDPIEALRYE